MGLYMLFKKAKAAARNSYERGAVTRAKKATRKVIKRYHKYLVLVSWERALKKEAEEFREHLLRSQKYEENAMKYMTIIAHLKGFQTYEAYARHIEGIEAEITLKVDRAREDLQAHAQYMLSLFENLDKL